MGTAPPAAAVIWLHGLGADGFDFVPIVHELGLPAALRLRFVFPHAPVQPVSINNGFAMPAWYDIRTLSASLLSDTAIAQVAEDEAGIRRSGEAIRRLIDAQVEGGLAASRVVLAGFSQGGAMALYTGLRYRQRLAGILALSTYLPLRQALKEGVAPASAPPILMCHGDSDPVVPRILGERSRDLLVAHGYAVEWRTYPMQHAVCPPEIADVAAWLRHTCSPWSQGDPR